MNRAAFRLLGGVVFGCAIAAAALAQTAPPAPGAPGAAVAPVPINITASQGIEWRQADEEVIATGNAKAIRGDVTVTADQLVAHYRKKAGTGTAAASPAPAPAAASASAAPGNPEDALDNGSTEIYQLDALGHVHIYTATDNAYGDHAVYNMDSAVLVLTGAQLKLTTPTDVITARDAIEYYSVKRMAVARGNALIVAKDGRSIAADTLIGYLDPAPVTPGCIQRGRGQPAGYAGARRQAEKGRRHRPCRDPDAKRNRRRRSRRLSAGGRQGPARRRCAYHPRTEPAERRRCLV
jgi:lipopolysaccharide export system protein LptA